MGGKLSQEQKCSIETLCKWLDAQESAVMGPQLVTLLEWIQKNVPDFLSEGALQIAAWQAVQTQLRATVAAGDMCTGLHLGTWWEILAMLKTNQQQSSSPVALSAPLESAGHPPANPKPLPLTSLFLLRNEEGPEPNSEEGSDPFDPGPIDPEKEPDLFPPSPDVNAPVTVETTARNWEVCRKEAIKQGDQQVALACLVIYQPNRPPE